MKKPLASLLLLAAMGLASTQAVAQAGSRLLVEFQGPGGHSNGAYGRTSAVHAAARSIVLLKAAGIAPGSYSITGLNGGNSVNSIASDARYEVRLRSTDPALVAQVTEAVRAGAAAENAFRGVKDGDLTGGAPATVRYTITPQVQ